MEDVLRDVVLADGEVMNTNGYGAHDNTRAAHSNQTAPDDLEDGELEDGEEGEDEKIEPAAKEQVPEINGNTPEKVSFINDPILQLSSPVRQATSGTHPDQSVLPDHNTEGISSNVSSAPTAILAGGKEAFCALT